MTTPGEVSMMSDPGTSQVSSANLLNDKMSPASSRSMKDYATQISELKKENFSLKLRIFYMEERMQEQFTGDHEQVLKSNIELKVECESLRKELHDKHDLLIKASNAVACMETAPDEARKAREDAQKELLQVKNAMQERVQEADREMREVREEADNLARNVHDLQDYVQKLEDDNKSFKKDLEEANEELNALKQQDEENETGNEPIKMQQEMLDKERLIEQLRETLEVKQTMVEALTDEKKIEQDHISEYQETIENLEIKNKELENELTRSKQHDERIRSEYTTYIELQHEYQQHISEQQQRLDEFEIAARQMSEELEKREEEVHDLTEALKDADATVKELADNLEEVKSEKEGQKSKELVMRDKAISGLTEVIRKKEDEVAKLKSELTRRETHLEELTVTISNLNSANEVAQHHDLPRLQALEKELQKMKNHNVDIETKNRELNAKLQDSEELNALDRKRLAEKDEKLQELQNKYKKLMKKQHEDELAAARAAEEQEAMATKFQKEKQEFAERLKQAKEQCELARKDGNGRISPHEVQKLKDQLQVLESHLRSKQLQLEEATNLFKKAENERKSTLDELEAAMKRRDEEQKLEVESRNRINAAKTSEIERLRDEIRIKEGRIEDLEDNILQLDQTAREARDKSLLSSREAARWKAEGNRKDNVIADLTKSLEDLRVDAPNYDHKQLIELTRENVELKQVIKARETEISFMQSEPPADDPYIQSLKHEIARKDKIIQDERQLQDSLHNAFVSWSKISEDTSTMKLVHESLRLDVENHKKELNNARDLITSLTSELEASHQQILALHKACEAKDRTIQDMNSLQPPYPTVESEEESGTTTEDLARMPGSAQKRRHRLKKRRPRSDLRSGNGSTLSKSTTADLKFETDEADDNFNLALSEDEDFERHQHAKEELEEEIQRLTQDLHILKDEHHDKVSLYESLRRIELQKKHLRELAEILEEEQKLYRSKLNLTEATHVPLSDFNDESTDLCRARQALDIELKRVDALKGSLQSLLLDVDPNHSCDAVPQANGALGQSVGSTIVPLNQTSYMEIPLVSNSPVEKADVDEQIAELQVELEKTRGELASAVRKCADLEGKSAEVIKLTHELQLKADAIRCLQTELQDTMAQRDMKESEMTALRIEVDKLRVRSRNNRGSDTDTTPFSGDESDGMGALSRRELRELINNAQKKLKNAEKLNELLRHQIDSSPKESRRDSRMPDPNLTKELSSEIERLKRELVSTRKQLEDNQEPSKRKTEVAVSHANPSQHPRSKLPVPVEKQSSHKPKESPSREHEEVEKLRSQCKKLQCKLSATEETVRQQTDKLKKCKAALAAAGINDVPLSPVRNARSQPNLLFTEDPVYGRDTMKQEPSSLLFHQRHASNETVEVHTQTSADDTGYSSLSLKSEQRYNSLIQAQAKELSVLRQQIKKSREICKDLRTEFDIVLRYITAALNSTGSTDTMLATSLTAELDRCKELTRKLKRQLAEWTDSSISDTDSNDSTASPPNVRRHTSQLMKKNQQLLEKDGQILDLEERLKDLLQERQDMDVQTNFTKSKQREFPEGNCGFLTPLSSHHSLVTNTEDVPMLRATISQNTEYVPLPDRRLSRHDCEETGKVQSPHPQKSLPMYQRTIAVTEYLPPNTLNGSSPDPPGRRRLPTQSDAENCTATYGGSWNLSVSPRKSDISHRPISPEDDFDHYLQPVATQTSDHDVMSLTRQLHDTKQMNRSLKEELDITNEALRESKLALNHSQAYRNPADILDEHLNEIRSLRQHLEESIETNDHLREELKKKLREAEADPTLEHVSANIYLPAESEGNEKLEKEIEGLRRKLSRSNEEKAKLERQLEAEVKMKNNYSATAKELEQLRMRLVESSCQTEMLGKHINDLSKEVQLEKAQNEALRFQIKQKDDNFYKLKEEHEETKIAYDLLQAENQDVKTHSMRLRDDMNRINEELDENHNFVRSLKSELALYEKFHKTKDTRNGSRYNSAQHPPALDITEFLAEIKILRVQLERSIEVNGALRRQLQEQLAYSKEYDGSSGTPRKTTTINIHHLPANTPDPTKVEAQAMRSSAPSSSRRKLKLNNEHKSAHVLMTPPPSASSCSEDLNMLAFEFSPQPGQSSTQCGKKTDDSIPTPSQRDRKRSINWPYYSLCGPYILGKLDDYKELKMTITDSRLLVRGMESNVGGKSHGARNFGENLHQLHKMLEDSGRLLKTFWPAAIPPPAVQVGSPESTDRACQKCGLRQSDASSDISKCTKDAGFGSDSSINSEADGLRREVTKLHKRLSAQDKLLQSTVDRLQTANRMKEGIEHAILKQLTVTHDVLKKARGNLEAKASETKSKDCHPKYS